MIWLFAVCLVIPAFMAGVGILWQKHPPRKINRFYGFRTYLSIKNQETWNFAHKHIATVWLYVGLISFVVSAALAGVFNKCIETAVALIIGGQGIMLVVSVFPTVFAMHKRFNSDGTLKSKG